MSSQATLENQIDTFITAGVDILAINLVDPASADTVIEKAKNANIPLALFLYEPEDFTVMSAWDSVWFIGANPNEGGITQVRMMVADWQANPAWDTNSDGKVQYVLLEGDPEHPHAIARTLESVKAFTDAGIGVEQLGLEADPSWSLEFGKTTMASWLNADFGSAIELVICNNDTLALGAIEAMNEATVNIPVYGFDAAVQDAFDAIEAGTLNGSVLNDGIGMAKAVIDLAINAVNGVTPVTQGTAYTLSTDGKKALWVPFKEIRKNPLTD